MNFLDYLPRITTKCYRLKWLPKPTILVSETSITLVVNTVEHCIFMQQTVHALKTLGRRQISTRPFALRGILSSLQNTDRGS